MDFSNLNSYPSGNSDGDDILMSASSLDRKLANILNSLSQHAQHPSPSGQNLLYQQPVVYDSNKVSTDTNYPLSRDLSTVDTSVLSLAFDQTMSQQPGQTHQPLGPVPQPLATTPVAPLNFQGNRVEPRSTLGFQKQDTNLLDSNHENVLLALANSVNLTPRLTSPEQIITTTSSYVDPFGSRGSLGQPTSPVFNQQPGHSTSMFKQKPKAFESVAPPTPTFIRETTTSTVKPHFVRKSPVSQRMPTTPSSTTTKESSSTKVYPSFVPVSKVLTQVNDSAKVVQSTAIVSSTPSDNLQQSSTVTTSAQPQNDLNLHQSGSITTSSQFQVDLNVHQAGTVATSSAQTQDDLNVHQVGTTTIASGQPQDDLNVHQSGTTTASSAQPEDDLSVSKSKITTDVSNTTETVETEKAPGESSSVVRDTIVDVSNKEGENTHSKPADVSMSQQKSSVDLQSPAKGQDVVVPSFAGSTGDLQTDAAKNSNKIPVTTVVSTGTSAADPASGKVKIDQAEVSGTKKGVKTRITLTGKQLASLLDKSSGKKVLHIVPQKVASGKIAGIRANLTEGSAAKRQGIGTNAKNVKVIQLKPSQIQQVKPGVYSFKLPQESPSTTMKLLKDSPGQQFQKSNQAQPFKAATFANANANSKGASSSELLSDIPSMCSKADIYGYSGSSKRRDTGASSSLSHRASEPEKHDNYGQNSNTQVIDLTCNEKGSGNSQNNIFDKFLMPDDSDNSSQDSQIDETTLIHNSLSSAVHKSKATRTVLKNASTREELYKDIKEHLRHHVSEKTAETIDLEKYEISDSESSDSSLSTPDKLKEGTRYYKRGVGIKGKCYGEPLRKVVIDRSQYNRIAQVGRNVILGMSSARNTTVLPSPLGIGTLKRKRGRPRKDEMLRKPLYAIERKVGKIVSGAKRGRKKKQKESFQSRFEKTELPERLKAKHKKVAPQENIIDLTKKQNSMIISENSFDLDEDISENVSKNLIRKGWSCTLCGKTCNVGHLDTLFGPYKIRVVSDFDEHDGNEGKTDVTSEINSDFTYLDIWLHRDCVVWTPNVCLVGQRLKGIGSALEEAGFIKCSLCSQYGASLACMSRVCGVRYHFVCAKQTGCQFREENFSILCSKHKYPQVN